MRTSPFRFLLLSGLFICLVCASAVLADSTPATIVIGGRVVPFQVKPFIGPDGQVLAPVDAVQLLGAKFTPDSDGTISVTAANGRATKFPYTLVEGRYCVPFAKVAQALGGTADWQAATQTLTVRAKLQMVRQDANALTIYTSYPVYYSVKRINNPERLYVDLFGLDLATTPASIPSMSGSVTHIRSGQMDYQTVRITVDLAQGEPFHVLSGIQASRVQVAFGAEQTAPSPLPVMPTPVAAVPAPPQSPLPVTAGPVTITGVDYKVISPALTQVSVTTTGQTHYQTEALDNPHRLAFDLAGASLDQGSETGAVGG